MSDDELQAIQDRQAEAQRLRTEAANLDRRATEKAEDNPSYAEHLRKRADHCRRLARDEE